MAFASPAADPGESRRIVHRPGPVALTVTPSTPPTYPSSRPRSDEAGRLSRLSRRRRRRRRRAGRSSGGAGPRRWWFDGRCGGRRSARHAAARRHPARPWRRRRDSLCVSTPPVTRVSSCVTVVIAIPSGCRWHAQPVTDRPVTGLGARASSRSRSTNWLFRWRSAHRADGSARRHRRVTRSLGQTRQAERHHPFSLAIEDAAGREYSDAILGHPSRSLIGQYVCAAGRTAMA